MPRRDHRTDDAQIPAIALEVDLLEAQPAVTDVVRRDFEPHGIPLAAVVRFGGDDRIDRENDAFEASCVRGSPGECVP